MTFKLLIAEDSHDVARVVALGARMVWPDCEVTIARYGTEALELFGKEQPDLVILDISMPPPDGFAVCQRIREVSQVPIVMLTVRNDTLDKIRAFELGADDYLTKPFDHLELFARLRALVRRSTSTSAQSWQVSTVGDLSLDPATHEVRRRGEVIPLTSTEYRLLDELVRHVGSVLPHQFLLEQVWGPEYINEVHYLKVLVGRLRRKLGDEAVQSHYIQTERGIGYRFVVPH